MAFTEAYNTVATGVICISFQDTNGRFVGKGLGYMVGNRLVTNNHVFAKALRSTSVHLSHMLDDGVTISDDIQISSRDFRMMFSAGSDEDNFDFAILDVPQLRSRQLYQFSLSRLNAPAIGSEAALLGFPLDHRNLVLHRAFISSQYYKKQVHYIQVDASVNSANSGGPLIDPDTLEVLGTVTRKNTGLTETMNLVRDAINRNISLVNSRQRQVLLAGVDPNEAFVASQNQILRVLEQIERSANVGIGYIFSVEHIRDEFP